MIKGFIKSIDLENCPLKGVIEVEIIKETISTYVVLDANGNNYNVGKDKVYDDPSCSEILYQYRWVTIKNCSLCLEQPEYPADRYLVIDGMVIETRNAYVLEYDNRNPDDASILVLDDGKRVYAREITKIYLNKKVAERCEETTVHLLDGTTQKMGGEQRKYMLNNEQQALIKEFERAYQACVDANIKFYFDCELDTTYAFNDPNDEFDLDAIENNESIETTICTPIDVAIPETNCDRGWVK